MSAEELQRVLRQYPGEPNTIVLPDGTSIGSNEKYDLEDYHHQQVCDGLMPLSDA